jgi:putative aldouronate transport system substrate-binding protein
MTKKRKVLTLILSVFMVTALFAGGSNENTKDDATTAKALINKTGLPIVNEPTTFKIVARHETLDKSSDIGGKAAVIKAEADTGIKIEWEEITQEAWDELIAIRFAAQELPDAIMGTTSNDTQLESLVPLSSLIDEYAPNLKRFLDERPLIKTAITKVDGNIYSLPWVMEGPLEMMRTWIISKKMLDQVGLEMPETHDEFYNALKAFKGLGKDIIPFSAAFMESASINGMFYNMFGLVNDGIGSDGGDNVMVEDGNIIFTGGDSRFYEMLKYLNKLYSEDLIDPNLFSYPYQDYLNAGATGKIGTMVVWWTQNVFVGEDNADDYVYMSAPRKNASDPIFIDTSQKVNMSRDVFMITKEAKYPEAIIRYVDYMNSSFENKLLWAYGPEGLAYKKHADGMLEQIDSADIWYTNALIRSPILMSRDDMNHFVTPPSDDDMIAYLDDVQRKYAYKERIPVGADTIERTERRALQSVDITTYMNGFVATSIIKGIDEAAWNVHLDTLKKLNIDQFVADYQTYYDWTKELQ